LLKVESDGVTKLEHLKAASRRIEVPELKYNDPDDEIKYILEHFYELKHSKGEKIRYLELKAYSEILALNLQPFEVELIMTIDRIFENSVH